MTLYECLRYVQFRLCDHHCVVDYIYAYKKPLQTICFALTGLFYHSIKDYNIVLQLPEKWT